MGRVSRCAKDGMVRSLRIDQVSIIHALRETLHLPCANEFAVGNFRAHGKEQLCRVSINKHTANKWHTAKCALLFRKHDHERV